MHRGDSMHPFQFQDEVSSVWQRVFSLLMTTEQAHIASSVGAFVGCFEAKLKRNLRMPSSSVHETNFTTYFQQVLLKTRRFAIDV